MKLQAVSRMKSLPLCRALLVAGVCAILYWLGPISTWETNDDVYYNLIFSGKLLTNAPDPHAVVVNYVLSSGFVALYTLVPSFPWYGAFHVAVILAAVFFLSYCYVRARGDDMFVLLLVVSVVCALPFLFYLQFTKTALVAGVAGYAGLFLLGEREDCSGWCAVGLYAVVGGFLLISFSLRKESFFLATLLCGWFLARAMWTRSRLVMATLGVTALLVLTFSLIHRYNYGADWQGFFTVSELAGPLVDHDQYGYQANKHVYDKVGWSSNDYYFFRGWGHVDERVYSPERARYVLENARKTIVTSNLMPALAGAIKFPVRNYLLAVAALALSVLLLHRQNYLLAGCAVLLPFLACVLITAWGGRFPIRVSAAMAFFLPWGLLLQAGALRSRRFVAVIAVVGLIGIAIPLYGHCQDLRLLADYRLVNNRDLHQLQQQVAPAPKLIVTQGSEFPYEGFLPFESVGYFAGTKLIWLSGMNQSPVQKQQLADNRIGDIFLTLMEDDAVYIVTEPMQGAVLKRYIQEHYHRLVGLVPAYSGIDFKMYRLIN